MILGLTLKFSIRLWGYYTMKQTGFTFLELIITLGIIAIIALFAIPQYDHFLTKHQQEKTIEQIIRTLTLARQQALLGNEAITLCPSAASQCGNNWSEGLLVQDDKKQIITQITFENQAKIVLKTFPAGHEHSVQFTGQGYTQTQNGSFYYCPENLENAQRIVFNQAGRVYVTNEEAQTGCV